jgi:hypothetical protein
LFSANGFAEVSMGALIRNPSKEQVRAYLGNRIAERTAPPSLQEIRRRLGWQLIEAERKQKAVD